METIAFRKYRNSESKGLDSDVMTLLESVNNPNPGWIQIISYKPLLFFVFSIKKYLEGQSHKWVCICEEETRFDLIQITGILMDYDHEEVH